MATEHQYYATISWTGNRGNGTDSYKGYDRSHTISVEGKPGIAGSSDQAFRGDGTKHNPEDLLVASLSACHMLWYLHLCATSGVVVIEYEDRAAGTMAETHSGSGHFTSVVLHPVVTVADASMTVKARELHHQAHKLCFIASSVNFPVTHQPEIRVAR
jgi:organic hydroperoxide reductase OsmC/OhrA